MRNMRTLFRQIIPWKATKTNQILRRKRFTVCIQSGIIRFCCANFVRPIRRNSRNRVFAQKIELHLLPQIEIWCNTPKISAEITAKSENFQISKLAESTQPDSHKLLRFFFCRNGGVWSDRRGEVWIGAVCLPPMKAIAKRCGSWQAGYRAINRMITGHSIPVLRSICILIRIVPTEYPLILILRHICGEIIAFWHQVLCTIQNAANRTLDTLELM